MFLVSFCANWSFHILKWILRLFFMPLADFRTDCWFSTSHSCESHILQTLLSWHNSTVGCLKSFCFLCLKKAWLESSHVSFSCPKRGCGTGISNRHVVTMRREDEQHRWPCHSWVLSHCQQPPASELWFYEIITTSLIETILWKGFVSLQLQTYWYNYRWMQPWKSAFHLDPKWPVQLIGGLSSTNKI